VSCKVCKAHSLKLNYYSLFLDPIGGYTASIGVEGSKASEMIRKYSLTGMIIQSRDFRLS
jgi:hypothetical protein